MLICQVAPLAGLVQVITGARGEGCPSAGAAAPHVATAVITAATCRIRNILTSARLDLAHSQFPWRCQAYRADFGGAGGTACKMLGRACVSADQGVDLTRTHGRPG